MLVQPMENACCFQLNGPTDIIFGGIQPSAMSSMGNRDRVMIPNIVFSPLVAIKKRIHLTGNVQVQMDISFMTMSVNMRGFFGTSKPWEVHNSAGPCC